MTDQHQEDNNHQLQHLTLPDDLLIPHLHLGRELTTDPNGDIEKLGYYILSILLPLPPGYELSPESSLEHVGNDVKVTLQVVEAIYTGVNISSGNVKINPDKLTLTSTIEVSLVVPEQLAATHDQIINTVHVSRAVPDIQLPSTSPELVLNKIKPHICLSTLLSVNQENPSFFTAFILVPLPQGYRLVESFQPIHDLNKRSTTLILGFDVAYDTMGEITSRVISWDKQDLPLKYVNVSTLLIDPQVSGSSEVVYDDANGPTKPKSNQN